MAHLPLIAVSIVVLSALFFGVTRKLLGSTVLGLLVLVALPVAFLCGLLMKLPIRKLVRAFLAAGGALFAVYEISKLLDVDKEKAKKKLMRLLEGEKTAGGEKVAEKGEGASALVEKQLVTALKSLGFTAEQAKEKAWVTITRLPEQNDLAVLVKEALGKAN
jgi:hypothetical protein